jgi:hypothetical protein
MPAKLLMVNYRPALRDRSIVAPLVLEGLQTKQRIIDDLINGRLDLMEAAARFQAVHRVVASLESTTGTHTAIADSECLCRTVIGWVHLALSSRPELAEIVSERLEQELQFWLDRVGQAKLPAS